MSGTAAALPSGLRRCLAGYLGGDCERGAFGGQVGGRRLGGVPDTIAGAGAGLLEQIPDPGRPEADEQLYETRARYR